MGCFLACFTASKRRKHHKSVNAFPSKDQSLEATEALPLTEPTKQEKAPKPSTESKAEVEKQLPCDAKQRVTFDLNVEANGESSTKEVNSSLVENNEEHKEETATILDSTVPSKVPSFNHRYQDCRSSLDEYEDVELQASDLDDDDNGDIDDTQRGVEEESSESLFSLSIDSRKHGFDAEIGEKEVSSAMPVRNFSEKEVKSAGSCQNARDRSQYVNSVLNPIENLTQWKEAQETPVPPPLKHEGKENASSELAMSIPVSAEPIFEMSNPNLKPKLSDLKPAEHEIGVDTSLSSWLIETETTPKSNASNSSVGNSGSGKANSPSKSHKDRPILGGWTVEELKQFSASSSPRKLRSQSPDETSIIIGTIGSYWIRTGQDMGSNSSSSGRGMSITPRKDTQTTEDQIVNFKHTPFEATLEGALNMGVAEA
ncbi:hypothetical protein FNV43_RR02796 [Rhamnella rubrinervis]|uniref:Uncharacterized protein n=1 Tax=Rhamnella rubrinervis TaxID=2594499 RepID=A0A8K0MNN7_9ROSA|nr:hypothetical protein FNV43_RR02796 [Rhamnella rubrinervis]